MEGIMENITAKIKQTKVTDLEKEIITNAASFMIGVFVITLFLFLVLTGWYYASSNSVKNVKDKIQEVDNQLSSYAALEAELKAFSGAVDNIQTALNQKKKWLPILDELSNVIPKNVVLSNLSLDSSGKLKIDGSTDSLTSLAKTLIAFKQDKENHNNPNPVFSNVKLTGFSFSNNGISFSLTMDTKIKETK